MAPATLSNSSELPEDVLIVEDDPIIALDLEDTILALGVKTVRTAGTVVRAATTCPPTSSQVHPGPGN